MTDHFYDLARIETNQKEMELSLISLPNLVEEIFLAFYEQLEEEENRTSIFRANQRQTNYCRQSNAYTRDPKYYSKYPSICQQ